MSNRPIAFLFFIVSFLHLKGQTADKELFINPLKEIPALSASFAELREDHFHTGLDYKTGGVTGKEILAVADGYVYRISVSSNGFGKALYVRHSTGYSSVYAHLERFRQDIEEYVNRRQYELKSFNVSLYPSRELFAVKQGEIIAWSGNSGGSSGPHLHFEMRETASESPVNPLSVGFNVADRIKPVIDKIYIYPLTASSTVNGENKYLRLKASGSGGNYTLPDQTVTVSGKTGIGIRCWDSFDNSSNRCGIYSIDLYVDSVKVFGFTSKKFSYRESRYINSHIDYAALMENDEYVHRTFLQPGNKLSMYNGLIDRGVISFREKGEHSVTIRVTDISGNASVLTFRLAADPSSAGTLQDVPCSKILPYGKASEFTADGIRIHFPASAFYDTLRFVYFVRESAGRFLSAIHSVHNETVPVHEQYRISIRPDTVIAGKENKMCLAYINKAGKLSYSGGEYRYGYMSSDVKALGDYAVSIDTVIPEIRPSFSKGADLTGRRSLTMEIKDDFSGIKGYELFIDGSWALAEYDAKNNLLIYRPDRARIREKSIHQIELRVTDNRDNPAVLTSNFFW